ncbi:hypothetical protein NHH03_20480 [Stieleria sp. TO1_6]|uniref:hypothetical protein n=1 Tax=Stieleria tagensis TaxID=2956795 RepID=UPI00209B7177|nr:hypothetical protein [Stieleria tagensis]MCO8124133.1 hypothetical protein [Stieleria tagensis]
MTRQFLPFVFSSLWVLFAASQDLAQDPTQLPAPRIITCGWNAPTASQFARDIDQMPGDLPLTGCVMTLHADSGNPNPLATAHSRDDWSRLNVQRSIDAVTAATKQQMADNYLLLKANPGDIDWLDDDGWQIISEHYRIAARLARQAGLKGLLFDAEPYTKPFRQFHYTRQPGARKHGFDEYQSAARRRGRQVMQAIADEFPDAELYSYFLLSYLIDDHPHRGPSPVGRSDANWCLAAHSYGLLPAFVDGWLDVIPRTMTIIDGCENAYWFETESQFADCAEGVRSRGRQLIATENQPKYDRQIRVAFPIYLDAIHPTLAGTYTLQPDRRDRLELLRRNLSAALQHSDSLVWLYGEHGRWWPPATDQALWHGKDTFPHWEEQLPGISQVIRDVVAATRSPQPDAVTTTDNSASPKPTSLKPSAADPTPASVSAEDDQLHATELDVQPVWESWRDNDSGAVVLQDGQVTITGSLDGAGLAMLPVEPNTRYMIQVQVVQQGRGLTCLSLRWRTSDGKWASTKHYDVVAYPPDGDPTQPRTITAVVLSPPTPHQMVAICSASQQLSDDDAALFGNLMIGQVEE